MSRTEQELMADFPDYHGLNYTNDLFKLISKLFKDAEVLDDTTFEFKKNHLLSLRSFIKDNFNNPSDINTVVHEIYDQYCDDHREDLEFDSHEFTLLLFRIREALNDINNKHQSRIIKLEVFIESFKRSGKWYDDKYFHYEFKKEDLGILWYDKEIHRIYQDIEDKLFSEFMKDPDLNYYIKVQATYMDGHTDILKREMFNSQVVLNNNLRDTTVQMEYPASFNHEYPEVLTYKVEKGYHIPILKAREEGTFGILNLKSDEREVLESYRKFIKVNGPFSFVTYSQVNNEYTFYRNSKKVINHATS